MIDLTSLLDVIFIILLVVVSNQRYLEENTEAERANAQVEQYLYNEQVNMANTYNVYISVYSNFDENNPVSREIHVLKNNEDIKDFQLNGNSVQDTLNEFKEYLVSYIDSNKGKPVVLSLNENDDAILYRDEKSIKAIYDELKRDYPDVYLK